MAVTMKDVAAYAGISMGTVSNYITGKTPVSEDKRRRIEEAINALGYKVNVAARNLRTSRFYTIGILIPDFQNAFLVRVIGYMEEQLHRRGYDMLVLSYHKNPVNEREQLKYLSQRVDGILLVPDSDCDCDLIAEIQKDIPVVMFNETVEDAGCDHILIDNVKIVQNAIEILFQKGHRKIGIIAGPGKAYTTRQRLLGYRRAHENYGYDIVETLIAHGDYSKTSGELLSRELIDKHEDVSALFVAGYRMTLGTLATLQRMDLQKKVAVVGYDASDIEDILDSKISFVYQSYQEVAQHAVGIILKRIEGDMEAFPETVNMHAEIKNIELLPQYTKF